MTPRPTRLRSALLLSLAGFLSLPAGLAAAEVVKLRTGETIKGRVVAERTNENVLVVEDYLLGGFREIAWGAVDKPDEERIKAGLGMGGFGDTLVQGMLVVYRLNVGTSEVRGVVMGQEAGFLLLKNISAKEPLHIPLDKIVSRDPIEMDAQEVWPPAEIFAKMRDEKNPQEAKDWYQLAVYGEKVGAYAEAKEAYETAAADEAYLQRALAQQGVTRMTAVLNDSEAIRTLNDLRNALSSQLWKRVREGIEGFATKHPDASEPVKKQLEGVKSDYTKKRAAAFAEFAGRNLEPIVKRLIELKVRVKDAAFNDIQAWLRKEAIDDAFAELTKKLQEKDPSVTVEECKTLFAARPKRPNSWRSARFDSGSFLIEPPVIKPPSGAPRPTQPQKGGNQGPPPNIPTPKPPTRDSWWTDASTDVRRNFWWAMFVEKSGLYEVNPKREKTPCSACDGAGKQSRMLSGGYLQEWLCTRCGGARFDLIVKYR